MNTTETTTPTLDVDKLAYAVAMAESGNCTRGIGVKKNNCFGIMTWTSGVRKLKYYTTISASYQDFKRIWLAYYKTFPTKSQAKRWTGGDDSTIWLNNVTHYYYEN